MGYGWLMTFLRKGEKRDLVKEKRGLLVLYTLASAKFS